MTNLLKVPRAHNIPTALSFSKHNLLSWELVFYSHEMFSAVNQHDINKLKLISRSCDMIQGFLCERKVLQKVRHGDFQDLFSLQVTEFPLFNYRIKRQIAMWTRTNLAYWARDGLFLSFLPTYNILFLYNDSNL